MLNLLRHGSLFKRTQSNITEIKNEIDIVKLFFIQLKNNSKFNIYSFKDEHKLTVEEVAKRYKTDVKKVTKNLN